MSAFVPGRRYRLDLQEAWQALAWGHPIIDGEPDASRGRRFLGGQSADPLGARLQWEFWMKDGSKVAYTAGGSGGWIVGQTQGPDPERPPPLQQVAGDVG